MYILIGFSGPKSREIVSVACNPVDKSDTEALCRALDWATDQNVSIVEIWDDKSDQMVCRLEV